MNAKDYWPTTKRLDAQYRREADKAVEESARRAETALPQELMERAARVEQQNLKLAQAWRDLKPGDKVINGILVVKKNRFSITSLSGTRYTIAEIFGSGAEAIIRRECEN